MIDATLTFKNNILQRTFLKLYLPFFFSKRLCPCIYIKEVPISTTLTYPISVARKKSEFLIRVSDQLRVLLGKLPVYPMNY